MSPVLAAMLMLMGGLVTVAVLTVVALVMVSGFCCHVQRRQHAAEMITLLTYFWHRRTRPDLDLVPAATPTSESRRRRRRVGRRDGGAGRDN